MAPETLSVATWPRSHTLEPLRVLSVQSHVCRDYVGNRAAVPLLQALGYHVDQVNSCEYASLFVHHGIKLSGEQGRSIIDGLRIAMDHPLGGGFPGAPIRPDQVITSGGDVQGIISGYIPNPQFMVNLRKSIAEMKAKNNKTIWVCDPVLGDAGHLYVPDVMINEYRETIQYADVITPNWFELKLLAYGMESEKCVDSIESTMEAIAHLRKKYKVPKIIICTSVPIRDYLITVISVAKEDGADTDHHFVYSYPCRASFFIAGTGDVFAASVLALLLRLDFEKTNIADEINKVTLYALSLTQAIIEVTLESYPANQLRSINPIGESQKEIVDCFNSLDSASATEASSSRWVKYMQSISESERRI